MTLLAIWCGFKWDWKYTEKMRKQNSKAWRIKQTTFLYEGSDGTRKKNNHTMLAHHFHYVRTGRMRTKEHYAAYMNISLHINKSPMRLFDFFPYREKEKNESISWKGRCKNMKDAIGRLGNKYLLWLFLYRDVAHQGKEGSRDSSRVLAQTLSIDLTQDGFT